MATTEPCQKCGEHVSTAAPFQHNCGMVEVPPEISNSCTWESDDDGIWNTACGQAFLFNDDGPTANGFKFCPYCGRPLIQVKPAE